jgi:hypothetical protein
MLGAIVIAINGKVLTVKNIMDIILILGAKSKSICHLHRQL